MRAPRGDKLDEGCFKCGHFFVEVIVTELQDSTIDTIDVTLREPGIVNQIREYLESYNLMENNWLINCTIVIVMDLLTKFYYFYYSIINSCINFTRLSMLKTMNKNFSTTLL